MLLNTSQAAQRLGISDYAVKKLCESGALKTLPIDPSKKKKFYRIHEQDVAAYKRALREQAAIDKQAAAEGKATTTVVPAGFVDAKQYAKINKVAESTVFGRVKAGQVERVKVHGRSYFRTVGMAAEKIGSTAAVQQSESVVVSGIGERLNRLESGLSQLRDRLNALISELGGV